MSADVLLPSPAMPGSRRLRTLALWAGSGGGSEALTREIAEGLATRGWHVEVLTSRVVDRVAWTDELAEGASHEGGILVRRFSSVHRPSPAGLRAQRSIQAGVMPPVDDQWAWVSWRYAMPDLFHYLLRHGSSFDAVVFSPYLFWHTIVGLSAAEANSVVMPCLHDEATPASTSSATSSRRRARCGSSPSPSTSSPTASGR